jgi:hypothetical protein
MATSLPSEWTNSTARRSGRSHPPRFASRKAAAQPQLTRCADGLNASIAAWRIKYQEGNGVGYGPVFSTPTVGVVKQSNSGFAFAGIDNPLFYADPTTMLRRRPTERRELTDELKAV